MTAPEGAPAETRVNPIATLDTNYKFSLLLSIKLETSAILLRSSFDTFSVNL
jgi:hypothetical protein